MARKVKLDLVILAALLVLGFNVPVFSGDANLVAHWTFDEGSGTIAYDSAGDNDGTLMGDPVWTDGQIGGALRFDGDGDYVDCGNTFASVTGSTTKTIMAWVKSATADYSADTGMVIELYRRGDSSSGFYIKAGGNPATWQSFHRISGSYTVLDSGVYVADEWAHVALVQDEANVDLYVNGVSEASASDAVAPSISSPPNATIGAYVYGSSVVACFSGSIDEVRIYNRALSAAEVEQLYWEVFSDLEIAIMQVEEALAEKEAALEGIDIALEKELVAYEALEEALESKDYGELEKSDIIKARQRIHSAIRHQDQSAGALERGVEQLGDALEALGVEPEPEIVYEVSGCGVGSLAAMESDETRFSVVVKGSYIYFEDVVTANCCADEVGLQMEVEGNLITIYEIEHATTYCVCICDYPATATLGPFEPGTYTVEVYGVYGGFIGSTTVTIGPERVKKDAKGLLKVVRTPKPKI